MQDEIKKNPKNALLLKATFMKLSSIMDAPMVRIIQANSEDMMSVSKYYSSLMIKFVEKVLQIIPVSVFEKLEGIIQILIGKMKQIPQKINRAVLKDYAQFDQRKSIAKFTHEISVFTDSILSMDSYLIGVIEVYPKTILEDGIRRELIRLIAFFFDKTLVFKKELNDI